MHGTTPETYYIGSGEQTKMYTLRVRYMELVDGSDPVERDYYVRNLSTDADTAVSRMKKHG